IAALREVIAGEQAAPRPRAGVHDLADAADPADPALPMRNRLPELRADRGWSRTDLAHRLEVSRHTVDAVEAGRLDPGLPLAFKIAAVFERRIEDLFFPSDSAGPDA
ncbi:MAG TPA: helix-turn-helix transcriptional regulator, partial [Streptomyces sp.]